MSRSFVPCTKFGLHPTPTKDEEPTKTFSQDSLSFLACPPSPDLFEIADPIFFASFFDSSCADVLPEFEDGNNNSLPVSIAEKEDIVSELEEFNHHTDSIPPEPPPKRRRTASSVLSSSSCVHARPENDDHYLFNVVRKKRTRMRSGVCVWCAACALMKQKECPKLRTRASGNDADWERWIRELASAQAGILDNLVGKLLPKNELAQMIPPPEFKLFYKEIAGALIEMALRELRGEGVDERGIMAQVRSSKYHKTDRVARIIEKAYACK